jgi:DNA-directed RNA polymerase beta' subunit
MKSYFEFDMESPDDIEKFNIMNKSEKMCLFIEDIYQKIFRPAFKHGYSDSKINSLIQEIGEEKALELIDQLRQIYNELLQQYEI